MPNPSLLIVPARFKTGRLYSQIPSNTDNRGDFNVTRATAATRVNSAGLIESVASGIPRLDYFASGGTVGCPALLVEPSGQNLLQRSEEFNDAYWSKVRCTASANQTTAPNGTLTADKLIMNNGESPTVNDMAGIYRSEAITSGAYRFSIFAKAAEFTGFKVRENVVSGSFMDVNLTNGAITNPDTAQFISPLAQNYGNGWYRISWTSPTITNLEKYSIRVGSTGDGASGIFIWGYQVETGSVATSYIPTTTGSVTRNADVISVSGAVSGSIGQASGTIYAEVDLMNITATKNIISTDDGSTSNRVSLFIDSSPNRLTVAITSSGNFTSISGSITTGVHKMAVSYASGDVQIFLNGGFLASGVPTVFPTVTRNNLSIGGRILSGVYGAFLNDRIRAAALYTTRLTNAQLAALTTP